VRRCGPLESEPVCPCPGRLLTSPSAVIRLHLGDLAWKDTHIRFPVHGFLIIHPQSPGLVDTGFGTGKAFLRDWGAVFRPVAGALAEHGVTPADIGWVVNSHFHFDHCGQNAVFPHVPFYVQRREYEALAQGGSSAYPYRDWFDFAGARFELLDGDAEIVPGVRLLTTPGHTRGHQSVLVDTPSGAAAIVGDAAYTVEIFEGAPPPQGAAEDPGAFSASLDRLRRSQADTVYFCHDWRVLKSDRVPNRY